MHGTINHGAQFVDSVKARMPLTYYTESSGVGLAIDNLTVPTGRRIGVVGLGVGTLAAYGRQGDIFRFYEIDPAVEPIARKWFTYLDSSIGTVEVVTGDGRLALEREANQHFDLLVLDAFSSDAIPIHLLTV
jgi:spermidine synthase